MSEVVYAKPKAWDGGFGVMLGVGEFPSSGDGEVAHDAEF